MNKNELRKLTLDLRKKNPSVSSSTFAGYPTGCGEVLPSAKKVL
jgi:hypothetical protein